MSLETLAADVSYDHRLGMSIVVSWKHGQYVAIGGYKILGPFDPYDVDRTCAALANLCKLAGIFEPLQVAKDWRRINHEPLPDPEDEPLDRRAFIHNFLWE